MVRPVSAASFADVRVVGIAAVGFDDNQLFLRRQRDRRGRPNAGIVGRCRNRDNRALGSSDMRRHEHDGGG